MHDQTVIGLREAALRVAIVADAAAVGRADAAGLVAQTLAQIAETGIPGCEVDLFVGDGAPGACPCDLVHVWTSGPLGTAWLRAAAAPEVPVLATYDPVAPALGFYDHSALVLSPSAAADAFLVARDPDPHLRLVLAGAGPRAAAWRARLGSRAVFLPDLGCEGLARVYASCELLLATDPGDVFGDSILEAQASGLPVLAVAGGAAPELIVNGRSGCVVAADPTGLAGALRGLARRATVLERLATGGLLAIRERSWETSLGRLADVYARAVVPEVARAA